MYKRSSSCNFFHYLLISHKSRSFRFVTLIYNLILSTGWSIPLHKQSSYIPTCCGGGHHHHQGRQNYRPKNTCIKKCLSCHEHIAILRVAPQHTAVDGLPPTYAYVGGRPSTALFKRRREIQRCVPDKIDTFDEGIFWSVVLSALMMVMAATAACGNIA